jgi:hypothetical protein
MRHPNCPDLNSRSVLPAASAFPPLKQVFFGVQKKFEKPQKKACQPVARSLNGGGDATNTSGKPFKKTLKK